MMKQKDHTYNTHQVVYIFGLLFIELLENINMICARVQKQEHSAFLYRVVTSVRVCLFICIADLFLYGKATRQ